LILSPSLELATARSRLELCRQARVLAVGDGELHRSSWNVVFFARSGNAHALLSTVQAASSLPLGLGLRELVVQAVEVLDDDVRLLRRCRGCPPPTELF
jgi:hypothetical protein